MFMSPSKVLSRFTTAMKTTTRHRLQQFLQENISNVNFSNINFKLARFVSADILISEFRN